MDPCGRNVREQDHDVRVRPGVEWRQVDDEIVALDLATSVYLGVNGTG